MMLSRIRPWPNSLAKLPSLVPSSRLLLRLNSRHPLRLLPQPRLRLRHSNPARQNSMRSARRRSKLKHSRNWLNKSRPNANKPSEKPRNVPLVNRHAKSRHNASKPSVKHRNVLRARRQNAKPRNVLPASKLSNSNSRLNRLNSKRSSLAPVPLS